ncbi:MAG TPA: S8 family serine peptidase [Actinomycetota bacterium]|nr:S8 family serine peptidase [Actinomycetota bacterium]
MGHSIEVAHHGVAAQVRLSPSTGLRVALALLASVFGLVMALPPSALAAVAVNDPLFSQQWGLQQIGAPNAWSFATGKNVTVGIVDTGIDLGHQDLAGKVVASTNCIGANADPTKCTGSAQDDNGHGTHVAGIIAADTNNGTGIAGVAPDAKLLVAKALDGTGAGADADVEAGIEWVVNKGAQVVNLSLGDGGTLPLGLGGTTGLSQPLLDGINYAWQHGAVPVLAAGNTGFGVGSGLLGQLLGATAAYGTLTALIVGATGPTGAVANYSSQLTSDNWAVVAPGGANDGNKADDVMSTYWVNGKTNQYTTLAGTSMATPHVTGAVADLLSMGYTQGGAVSQILSSADKGVACGQACSGLLDLSKAVGGPATPAPSGAGAASSPNPLVALLNALGI